MGFIIADGFDDRWILNNGYTYGNHYDGWGLYDDVYIGDGEYEHLDSWGGSQELGRYGGWAMMLTDDDLSYNYCSIEKTIPSGKDWCGGIAVNSIDEDAVFAWFENANKFGPIIEFDTSGDVVVKRSKVGSSSREVVARSNAAARLTMWGWIYITFQFHCGDTGSDWIKIWINSEKVIDVDHTTLNFDGAVDLVSFPDVVNACDDLWLKNNTDTIFPEARILALFPNGAGDDTECAPVGEASNYQNVQEFEQNFDLGYNLADIGEKDSFEMDAITDQVSVGVVHALVARFFVKGDTGNTDDIRPYVISGGNKYNGTPQTPVEGRYTYIQETWETNPDTSVAWTVAELDAVQIGYEVV